MRIIRTVRIPAGSVGAFQIDLEAQIEAGVLQFTTSGAVFTQWVEGWMSLGSSTKWSYDFTAGNVAGSAFGLAGTLITVAATSMVGSLSVDYPNGVVSINVTANTLAVAVDVVVDVNVIVELV